MPAFRSHDVSQRLNFGFRLIICTELPVIEAFCGSLTPRYFDFGMLGG